MTALAPYGWWLDFHPQSAIAFSGEPTPLTPGKYYWEVTITEGGADGTSGYGILMGVAEAGMALVDVVDTAVNLAQAGSQYGAFINIRVDATGLEAANGWGYPNRSGGIGQGSADAVGNVYGLALDTLNKKLWYRNLTRNLPTGAWGGGASPGDPAANTEGCSLTFVAVTGPVYVMVGASHGAASAKGAGTINFGASAFTGTAPTGFVSIESVWPAAQLNPSDTAIVISGGNLAFAGTNVPTTGNLGLSYAARSRFSIAQAP